MRRLLDRIDCIRSPLAALDGMEVGADEVHATFDEAKVMQGGS